VVKLKAEIARTEKIRDDLVAKGSDGKQAAGAGIDNSPNSPLLQLQSQLQATQAEISNREQGVAGLKTRIAKYQGSLNDAPAIEQKLAELNRGYGQSKTNYDDLLKKRDDSARAEKVEEAQQGERFSPLDPPSLPQKPDFPNRLKFCAIGLGVGLMLGVAVAGSFEFFDDRLHDEAEMKAILAMAIVSEIPAVLSPMDERLMKKKMTVGWAFGALVIVTILAGSAISYLRG
jgi:uncharacterized protein involved in exopolysaccharide biosynthesis